MMEQLQLETWAVESAKGLPVKVLSPQGRKACVLGQVGVMALISRGLVKS